MFWVTGIIFSWYCYECFVLFCFVQFTRSQRNWKILIEYSSRIFNMKLFMSTDWVEFVVFSCFFFCWIFIRLIFIFNFIFCTKLDLVTQLHFSKKLWAVLCSLSRQSTIFRSFLLCLISFASLYFLLHSFYHFFFLTLLVSSF